MPVLGHKLPEAIYTARKFRNAYKSKLNSRKRQADPDEPIISVDELPVKKRGRPLLQGIYDSQVQDLYDSLTNGLKLTLAKDEYIKTPMVSVLL